MADDLTFEVRGLDQIIGALKGKLPQIQVGILGDSARVAKEGKSAPSNALVGAVHEFGAPSRGIPQRSFLRMPLADHLYKEIESSPVFTKDDLKNVAQAKTITPWLKKIAVLAEGVIQDAFDTGGFGSWPAWKDPNYHNGGGQLLVDTQQLRNSIIAEVKP